MNSIVEQHPAASPQNVTRRPAMQGQLHSGCCQIFLWLLCIVHGTCTSAVYPAEVLQVISYQKILPNYTGKLIDSNIKIALDAKKHPGNTTEISSN